MLAPDDIGILSRPARGSVDEVLERLLSFLRDRSVTVFAVIDHSGEAEKVGLSMPPTKLVLFGNPRAGTPVMLAAPSAALDLPLKILIAEAADGTTHLSYNSTAYLGSRHSLSPDLLHNLAAIEGIVAALAT